jgi:hypothetical protein
VSLALAGHFRRGGGVGARCTHVDNVSTFLAATSAFDLGPGAGAQERAGAARARVAITTAVCQARGLRQRCAPVGVPPNHGCLLCRPVLPLPVACRSIGGWHAEELESDGRGAIIFFALHRAAVCILAFPPPPYPSTSPHFSGVFFSFALLGHRGCRSWRHPTVVSTRHYRAPEIIMQLGWSYPADMWSMGCILVELVTGEVLFGMGQSQSDNTLAHLATMHQLLGPFPCAPLPSPFLYPTLEHAACLRAYLSAFKVARALFCAGPPVSPVGIRVVLCSPQRAHQAHWLCVVTEIQGRASYHKSYAACVFVGGWHQTRDDRACTSKWVRSIDWAFNTAPTWCAGGLLSR